MPVRCHAFRATGAFLMLFFSFFFRKARGRVLCGTRRRRPRPPDDDDGDDDDEVQMKNFLRRHRFASRRSRTLSRAQTRCKKSLARRTHARAMIRRRHPTKRVRCLAPTPLGSEISADPLRQPTSSPQPAARSPSPVGLLRPWGCSACWPPLPLHEHAPLDIVTRRFLHAMASVATAADPLALMTEMGADAQRQMLLRHVATNRENLAASEAALRALEVAPSRRPSPTGTRRSQMVSSQRSSSSMWLRVPRPIWCLVTQHLAVADMAALHLASRFLRDLTHNANSWHTVRIATRRQLQWWLRFFSYSGPEGGGGGGQQAEQPHGRSSPTGGDVHRSASPVGLLRLLGDGGALSRLTALEVAAFPDLGAPTSLMLSIWWE